MIIREQCWPKGQRRSIGWSPGNVLLYILIEIHSWDPVLIHYQLSLGIFISVLSRIYIYFDIHFIFQVSDLSTIWNTWTFWFFHTLGITSDFRFWFYPHLESHFGLLIYMPFDRHFRYHVLILSTLLYLIQISDLLFIQHFRVTSDL